MHPHPHTPTGTPAPQLRDIGRQTQAINGEHLVILAHRRDVARLALQEARISPDHLTIATSPEDLRGLTGPLDIRRIGLPFPEPEELRLREVLASTRHRLTYGL